MLAARRVWVLIIITAATVLSSMGAFGETVLIVVSTAGSMDENEGYFADIELDGNYAETYFMYPTSDWVCWHAYIQSGDSDYTMLPPNTYWVPLEDSFIGETWDSWTNGSAVAAVVDYGPLMVRAGTFDCYQVELRDPISDLLTSTIWFASDVGWVKHNIVGRGVVFDLSSYQIEGGTGLLPLAVGNWWYSDNIVDVHAVTWGGVKSLFR